ncbi:hypothetical protein [Streptomyces sp. NPDC050560]|uniref:hypothetical protein n=1 Tax=Streptomyces sp. NPDC050560 TaxID=3365630 RepID=UPI00378A9E33
MRPRELPRATPGASATPPPTGTFAPPDAVSDAAAPEGSVGHRGAHFRGDGFEYYAVRNRRQLACGHRETYGSFDARPPYKDSLSGESNHRGPLRADETARRLKSVGPSHMVHARTEKHGSTYGFDDGTPFAHTRRPPHAHFASPRPHPTKEWAGLSLDGKRSPVDVWAEDSPEEAEVLFPAGEFTTTHSGGIDRSDRRRAVFPEFEAHGRSATASWRHPGLRIQGVAPARPAPESTSGPAEFTARTDRQAAKSGGAGTEGAR